MEKCIKLPNIALYCKECNVLLVFDNSFIAGKKLDKIKTCSICMREGIHAELKPIEIVVQKKSY